MKVKVAKTAGVCFGVERALNMSEKALLDAKGEGVTRAYGSAATTDPSEAIISSRESIVTSELAPKIPQLYSLGPLIHNPQTVEDLSSRGLKPINSISEASGTIVFRSHGVTREVQAEAMQAGLKIVDATCPLVKVPQNFARKLSEAGYFVVIVGDAGHPEIQGVKSYVAQSALTDKSDNEEASGNPSADLKHAAVAFEEASGEDAGGASGNTTLRTAELENGVSWEANEKPLANLRHPRVAVVKGPDEIDALPMHQKVGVICQTTLKRSVFDAVVEKCKAKFPEVKVHNTICSATKDRQEAAYELSNEVEAMVVIGGRNSSNTQKLFDICQDITGKAFLIETEEELKPEWFSGLQNVGITAGASTPHTVIERVREKLENFA